MGSRLRILPRMSLESRWTVIIATLLVLSMSVQPASANDNAPLLKVDAQIDGQTRAMGVAGSRLYLGIGSRMDVLDVSQPSRPVVVGVDGRCTSFNEPAREYWPTTCSICVSLVPRWMHASIAKTKRRRPRLNVG